MTDSTIGVAEPGSPTKLLQAYQNTVSGQTVQAEGVVQVDLNGVPVPRGSATEPVRIDPTGTTIQPISGTVTASNLQQWMGSTAPTVGQKTKANSLPVTLASDQGNLGVSGTITANQGTANTLANAWPVKVTDGIQLAGVTNVSNDFSGGFGERVFFGDVPAVTFGTGTALTVQNNNNASSLNWLGTPENTIPAAGGSQPGVVLPALANATPPSKTEGAYVALSTDLSGNLRASLASLPNPSNLPKLSLDPQGNLQVNNNNLRAVEERIMMLTELNTLNSLIASDNGSGARNYQELR
jgi:hypothetical protein